MIKFFRNIRQKLLKEGKTISYLKYAIGEIILVVIGILIALQINNWNQSRIEHKETKLLLNNLKLDVQEDIKNLLHQQNSLRIRKIQANIILKSLDGQKVSDSAQFIRAITRVGWIINYSQTFPTYNEIVSSGKLSYIKSEKIKKALADYQSQVDENQQIMASYHLGLKETERLGVGYLIGIPKVSNPSESVSSYPEISFDLNLMASDSYYYSLVKHISFHSSEAVAYVDSQLITRAQDLKAFIEEELKNY